MKPNRIVIGSQVAVIDEDIKGYVVALDGSTVTIKDADGFERVFLINEIVRYDDKLEKDTSKVPVKEVPVFSTQTNAKIVQVVDLHNSVKVKNKNLILVNQLQKFHRNLNHAIRNKQSSIVFIHGVGQGVLKSNLERLLRKNNIQFTEASYQKYGYGAMEIFINTATKPLIYRAD